MARAILVQIANETDADATEVMANFNQIGGWFDEGANGIKDSDISTTANIAGSKINLDTNTDFIAEHSTAGAHKFASNRTRGLTITRNSTNPSYQVNVAATAISFEDSDGALTLITDPSIAVMSLSAGQVEGGTLEDVAEASDQGYYIVALHDSTADAECGVFYSQGDTADGTTAPEDILDDTFWETDLVAFNTAVSAAYDNACVVGYVYNKDNGASSYDLEPARPRGGGSFSSPYLPRFTMAAAGTYSGNGTTQDIDCGFRPDFILIKRDGTAREAVWWCSGLTEGYALQFSLGTAAADDIITDILFDGFTVGTANRANESGHEYYWTAWCVHDGVT